MERTEGVLFGFVSFQLNLVPFSIQLIPEKRRLDLYPRFDATKGWNIFDFTCLMISAVELSVSYIGRAMQGGDPGMEFVVGILPCRCAFLEDTLCLIVTDNQKDSHHLGSPETRCHVTVCVSVPGHSHKAAWRLC